MIKRFRHIGLFLSLYVLLLAGGIMLLRNTAIPLEFSTYLITLSSISLITILTYVLVMIGTTKKDHVRGYYLLAGLGLKFILYLVFILIMWIPAKNLSKPFIIAFFVLYLMLTISLLGVLYKVLRTN